ncbi:Histidine--tRNA ligase, cytoplasmic [Hondaea fermentalgiana]|uniref:histidine--tRNA ligase n=1 Tax=Hondaea fermentalgiana TaxID=2315210 RepID=A0A2R5GK08_9STRA|nr:Histidine--tRNA ligase, cytoplasmic [Hondaea fermentalgiana]|eukprot:GBG30659.1 Histidine--tRNA ligase, cytoplasmic [Hondaea fermentalgiana]
MEVVAAAAIAAGAVAATAATAADDVDNNAAVVDEPEASYLKDFKELAAGLPDDVEALQKMVLELRGESASKEAEAAPKKSKKKGGKYQPKTPLGMRDYHPEEMAVRERVFDTIKGVFKRHGAVSIETPVAELKETLTGKYGEDSKLIYDLADQGGEILALRYDLTVPFARYCAEHGVETIKRYHIARVYRRDNPVMTKGRYREFYQCDIDIAGEYEPMVADAECVKIVTDILGGLDVGDFLVKINHRQLLDGIFAVCGVPDDLFRPICSAVDKLDKTEWPEVKEEMIRKGISGEVAEKIWGYAQQKGGPELVAKLLEDEDLCANESAKAGLDAMKLLFEFCDCYGVPANRVSFDLSMARGLDYYTGVIYEAVLVGAEVGSVAGGGRYDNLVGMFLAKKGKKKDKKIPCVGVSLGIERLFTVVANRQKSQEGAVASRPTEIQVVGIATSEDKQEILRERMKVCSELWEAGVSAETSYKASAKFMTQVQHCEKNAIPFAVVVGKSELEAGKIKIRNIVSKDEEEVPRDQYIARLKELLAGSSQ